MGALCEVGGQSSCKADQLLAGGEGPKFKESSGPDVPCGRAGVVKMLISPRQFLNPGCPSGLAIWVRRPCPGLSSPSRGCRGAQRGGELGAERAGVTATGSQLCRGSQGREVFSPGPQPSQHRQKRVRWERGLLLVSAGCCAQAEAWDTCWLWATRMESCNHHLPPLPPFWSTPLRPAEHLHGCHTGLRRGCRALAPTHPRVPITGTLRRTR